MVPARAGPGDVAAWIRALSGADPSEETVRAMATIERYVVNVGWAYRIAGLDDPTAPPLVRLEKKAARKALGVRQRQARAIRFKGDVSDFDSPASGVCLAHRSEEHTSELQSLMRISYAVFCLKKKKQKRQ